MSLLLVDDRDGRIVAELRNEEELVRVLEAMAREEPSMLDYLCLVEGHSTQGALLGADTTLKIRTLPPR